MFGMPIEARASEAVTMGSSTSIAPYSIAEGDADPIRRCDEKCSNKAEYRTHQRYLVDTGKERYLSQTGGWYCWTHAADVLGVSRETMESHRANQGRS
jgi:hypothetical protein